MRRPDPLVRSAVAPRRANSRAPGGKSSFVLPGRRGQLQGAQRARRLRWVSISPEWGPRRGSRTLTDVLEHADLEEVRRECRAQIERAIYWGFDVSHLDSHMATLQLRPEFFDVYLELAVDFSLPIRLSGASSEGPIGFPFRRLAAEEGGVFPDHLVVVNTVGTRRALERALLDLRPGVTEIYAHPAVDTGELRAPSSDWPARVDDHDLLTNDHSLPALASRAGAELIGYPALHQPLRTGP